MTEAVIVCGANQWTGFYMITASVMKELTQFLNDRNVKSLVSGKNLFKDNENCMNRLTCSSSSFEDTIAVEGDFVECYGTLCLKIIFKLQNLEKLLIETITILMRLN